MAMTGPGMDLIYNGSGPRIPRVHAQHTSVAFVSQLTANTFIAHSQTGVKVGVAPNLRSAQLLIENAYGGNMQVRWARQVDAAGIERWVASIPGPSGIKSKDDISNVLNTASTGLAGSNLTTGTLDATYTGVPKNTGWNWFGGQVMQSANHKRFMLPLMFRWFRWGKKITTVKEESDLAT